MTNAERIRCMTDEELAEMINRCDVFNCKECMFRNNEGVCVVNSYDKVNKNGLALMWLKEEAKGEDINRTK